MSNNMPAPKVANSATAQSQLELGFGVLPEHLNHKFPAGPKRAFAKRAQRYALGKSRVYQTQRQKLLAGGAVMLAFLIILIAGCLCSQDIIWSVVTVSIATIVIAGLCAIKCLIKMRGPRQDADLFATFTISGLDTVERCYDLRLLSIETSTAERRAARAIMREAYRVFVGDPIADLNVAIDKIVYSLKSAP